MTETQAGYELPAIVREAAEDVNALNRNLVFAALTRGQCVDMVAAFDRLTAQVQRVRDLLAAKTVGAGTATEVRYLLSPEDVDCALDGLSS
jgi:hypothetical protein